MTESDAKVGLKMMMTTVAFILVGVVVVFSVKRFNYASPKDIHWLRNIPIAHRGLHDEKHDENSLGSFDNAVSNGYAIELDVRLTKDRVPVVIHDNNLKRIFGLNQSVSKMSVADLKEHRLPKSGEKVPTLSEALEHINGRAPVLIEIKNFGLPGKLEPRVLEVLEGYKGKYAIQSFNPLVLRWFKQHDQELPLGLLLADVPFLRF
jgi:glycerophosphoryl diester phosphodiesterase